MRRALLALVLVLTACGSASGPSAESSAQPTATAVYPSATPSPVNVTPPAAGLLFAVVENAVGSGCCGGEPTGVTADTVAIVGLDGYARAEARFQPRKLPPIENAAFILQAPAVVAGSGVYYIDGTGTVRVLRVGSQPQVVASFSQQPQLLETWFAVRPDGTQILAGTITYAAIGPMPSSGPQHPPLIGPWKFSLVTAPSGGTPVQLVDSESATAPYDPGGFTPLFPVGWISTGPIAMNPVSLSSQNVWLGGPLQVLTYDSGGVRGRTVGGPDCNSAATTRGGLIPCISSTKVVSVRDSLGTILWTTHIAGLMATSLYLSPDGQAISDGSKVETRIGGVVPMPQGFRVQGWLDSNTVAGTSGGDGNLSWISLGDPTKVHDLGFKGDFVATLA